MADTQTHDIEKLELEIKLTQVSMENCTQQAQLAQANHRLLVAHLGEVQAQLEAAKQASADEAAMIEKVKVAKDGDLPALITSQVTNEHGEIELRTIDGSGNLRPLTRIERAIMDRSNELRRLA